MNIVSYRGPGMAGGVSAALARAWEANVGPGSVWWHIGNGNELRVATDVSSPAQTISTLSNGLIKGHYNYCNEFIWPVMHDLPQFAVWKEDSYRAYNNFNRSLSWFLVKAAQKTQSKEYFVQDYQLALMPSQLKENGLRSMVFWHIPWPKNVADEHVDAIKELAEGLLGAEVLGFHTEEYGRNFLQFVEQHVPGFRADYRTMTAYRQTNVAHVHADLWRRSATKERIRAEVLQNSMQRTRVVVAPLGIDFDHWSNLAFNQNNMRWHPSLLKGPFVLSVDRTDYTKGVVHRIKAIDSFFENYPDWRGRIVFAQLCGKTRTGIDAFDRYWDECQRLSKEVKQKWSSEDWQPLLWVDTPFTSAELATLYRTASLMLVNPVRDGLNLTAKEYVACQGPRNPGVLALSHGAGAWHELGNHAVPVEPADHQQMAATINSALLMDRHERAWRVALMQQHLKENCLSAWWNKMVSQMRPDTSRPAATAPTVREGLR